MMKPHEDGDDGASDVDPTAAIHYDPSFSGFPGGFREWAGLVKRPRAALLSPHAALAARRAAAAADNDVDTFFARERRDQGALWRVFGGGHVFGLCVALAFASSSSGINVLPTLSHHLNGPSIAISYAAAGLLALLAAVNAAELAARRPLAGPAGVVSLLLASLGPLPAVIAAASLVLQHVVAAAMVARAFMPAVWRIVAVVASGADDGAASPSAVSFSHGPLPPTLDPVAATLVLLASAAAAAAGPKLLRAVAWFCAAAGGGAALASTVAAALTLASLKGGPVQQPLFNSSSAPPTTTAADLLLGPVAAAAGAALVSSFAAGVALPPAFADDARQPARAVPRGMVGAAALAAVVQTLAALGLGLLPQTVVAATTTPTLAAAHLLFSLAAALGALAGVPALVLGASRLVCGTTRHRLLPFAGFGRVVVSVGCCRCRGRRFRLRLRSPMAATGLVAAAAVPLALLLEAPPSSLGGLLAVGFVATQAMVAVAVLLERSRDARAVGAGATEQQQQPQQPQQPQRQQEEQRPPSAQPPPASPQSFSSSCSADGHVSIRSASPPPSEEADARCGDPRWWARGAGATWLPRFLVGTLAACSCGAASALGAAASLGPTSSSSSSSSSASPGDALWPLTALFGGWFVATALLHFCSVVTRRAAEMLAAEERAAAAGVGGRGDRRRSDNNKSAFRAPCGPWLPSLSLFLLGVAGGAALPLSALLRWLILVAVATGAWLLYGLPAAQARATRWAAEDAAEEEARAAEAEEEGRRRWWEAAEEEEAERERERAALGAAAAAGEATARGAGALGEEGDEANHT